MARKTKKKAAAQPLQIEPGLAWLRQENIQTVCMLVLAALALGFVFSWLRGLFIPLILALGAFTVMAPLVDWVQDHLPLPRWIAVILVFSFGVGATIGLGLLAAASAREFVSQAPLYREQLLMAAQKGLLWFKANSFGMDVTLSLEETLKALPVLDWASQLTGGIVGAVSTVGLAGIVLAFLLFERGESRQDGRVRRVVDAKVRIYLIAKTGTSLLVGLVTWAILAWLGISMAFLFGLAAFFLNFIPGLGFVVAVSMPLPVAFLQFGMASDFWLAFLLPTALQAFVGNVLETRLMSETMGLHPVAVILGLFFWGALWGPMGMFLAVPMTAVARILLSQSEATRPLARVLEGKAV